MENEIIFPNLFFFNNAETAVTKEIDKAHITFLSTVTQWIEKN